MFMRCADLNRKRGIVCAMHIASKLWKIIFLVKCCACIVCEGVFIQLCVCVCVHEGCVFKYVYM